MNPEEEVGISCRSRPVNLRQQPRARYNDDLEDLGLSSDDEPKPKPKRKWAVISDSSGESDQEETKEKETKEKETKEKEATEKEATEKEGKEKEGKEKEATGKEAAEKPEEGATVEEGEEDEMTACNSPLPAQHENLTRAQQKNPRTRRGGKKVVLYHCHV